MIARRSYDTWLTKDASGPGCRKERAQVSVSIASDENKSTEASDTSAALALASDFGSCKFKFMGSNRVHASQAQHVRNASDSSSRTSSTHQLRHPRQDQARPECRVAHDGLAYPPVRACLLALAHRTHRGNLTQHTMSKLATHRIWT